jgi:hypothetical protein
MATAVPGFRPGTVLRLQRLREVQDKPAADTSGSDPSVRFAGLRRRQDLGHPKCEGAFFNLTSKLIEELRVPRRG